MPESDQALHRSPPNFLIFPFPQPHPPEYDQALRSPAPLHALSPTLLPLHPPPWFLLIPEYAQA